MAARRFRVDPVGVACSLLLVAVPLLLLVDPIGSVRRSFVGEPSATYLWSALAELREPGSVPPGCDHSGGCDHD